MYEYIQKHLDQLDQSINKLELIIHKIKPNLLANSKQVEMLSDDIEVLKYDYQKIKEDNKMAASKIGSVIDNLKVAIDKR